MHDQMTKSLRIALMAAAVAIPLAGCSTGNFSSYGGAKLEVAELAPSENHTAQGALAEARSHFRNSNYGYSAAYYKKAVELSPKVAEAYVGLGASYDQLGRFDLADRVYASLYKLSGGTVQYYNNVGYSHLLRGDLKDALMYFEKAHRLDPANPVIANNLQMLSNAADAARA